MAAFNPGLSALESAKGVRGKGPDGDQAARQLCTNCLKGLCEELTHRQVSASGEGHGMVSKPTSFTVPDKGSWNSFLDDHSFMCEDDSRTIKFAELDTSDKKALIAQFEKEGREEFKAEIAVLRDLVSSEEGRSRDPFRLQIKFEAAPIPTHVDQVDSASAAVVKKEVKKVPSLIEQGMVPYNHERKEYVGSADQVFNALRRDPVVNAIFPEPEMLLDIIGSRLMSRQFADIADSNVSVELNLFEGNTLNVVTRFPAGIQDTSITYYGSPERGCRVSEVKRHRSRKDTKDGANVFISMVEQQAEGVRRLAQVQRSEIHYYSDSIRDEASGAIGYNVWPKMGFTARMGKWLPSMKEDERCTDGRFKEAKQWLDAQHSETVELADMFSVPDKTTRDQLSLLWKDHGGTVKEATFDYSEGSKSRRTLELYKSSKA